jgi:hypothetical protein
MATLAQWAQRTGYGLLLVAIAAFGVGLFAGFSGTTVAIVTVCLAATTVTLAPGIVLGYAVRAAQREDDERSR